MSEEKSCPDADEGGSSAALSLDSAPEDPIPVSLIPVANVSQVKKYSPLRYPGGKTWLIPHIHAWLTGIEPRPKLLIEPFAGGAIVSLTAVMDGLVDRCWMMELDRDVAAFWRAALRHGPALCEMIRQFQPTRKEVEALSRRSPANDLERGFRTLVMNRTRSGGILAPGAALLSYGENGKGVASRWYPETLIQRLADISNYAPSIRFFEANGIDMLRNLPDLCDDEYVLFVDPPYTAGGKRAGKRLYARNEVDHDGLFELLADTNADFLATYDMTDEILTLVRKHGFHAIQVLMKNTHHTRIPELVISPRRMFATKECVEAVNINLV